MPEVRTPTSTPRIRGRRWERIRRFILNSEPLCVGCSKRGRVSAAQEVDHIVPLSRGGSNESENLQALCTDCHLIKTTGKARVRVGTDGWPQ